MIIRTRSGSRYEIADGICTKYNDLGTRVDAFKVYFTKALPLEVRQMGEIWDYPHGEPEVGKLLYIGGKDGWWLSTEVISIEKEPSDD
jgi:hypothetical protein